MRRGPRNQRSDFCGNPDQCTLIQLTIRIQEFLKDSLFTLEISNFLQTMENLENNIPRQRFELSECFLVTITIFRY